MPILKEYLNSNFSTPQILKNKYVGSDALIIGTGNSTSKLIQYKDKLKKKFGVIIGLNFSTKNFEDIMDYRLIVEKKADSFVADLNGRSYRKDLIHIINWKGINNYPPDIPKIKTTRSNFDFKPNIREYRWHDNEGLLIGPTDSIGLSAGSVSCQGLHLACIMGARNVYLIGADLMFSGSTDHYYGGNYYANSKTKLANRSPFVEVEKNGVKYRSTELFRESAKFIDKVIIDYCRPAGIEVYDFSDGLILKANKPNIDIFMKDDRLHG